MIPKTSQFHSFTVSQNGQGGWGKNWDQGNEGIAGEDAGVTSEEGNTGTLMDETVAVIFIFDSLSLMVRSKRFH